MTAIERLKKLGAKDEHGGFIYRDFEAHISADRIILEELIKHGGAEIVFAYRELQAKMQFEYGNE